MQSRWCTCSSSSSGAAAPSGGDADSTSQPAASSGAGDGLRASFGMGRLPQANVLPLVPWGLGKTAAVMGQWLIAFIMVGQLVLPMAMSLLGLDAEAMSMRGTAVLNLCVDLGQLSVTIGILWGNLRAFDPRSLGLFPFRFRPPTYLWVVLACALMFPVIDQFAHHVLTWFTSEPEAWTSQMEHSLSVGDWVTNGAYFVVFSICAPVWEELIFRGFLLPSLARHMPPPAAVVASSLVFALCHFKMQTLLPLLLLGVVFSSVYLYCRNLVPCILLHSLWNMYVLVMSLTRAF